jgi:FkbM family methyltransferase
VTGKKTKGVINMVNTQEKDAAASNPEKGSSSRPPRNSTLNRGLQFFREYGPIMLLWLAIYKLARVSMEFLNNRIRPKNQKGYVVKEILGSKMNLDLADPGISQQLMIDGIREAMSVGVVKRLLKEGDVIVEAGANIGYYALLESRLIGNKGKIYAIEPVPANMELLRKNIALNGYTNIETYQLAVGDVPGVASMYLTSQRNLPTLRDIKGTNKEEFFTEEIKVQLATLDDFLRDKKYPSFIRMDVEGYEYQIIKGMKETLAKKLPLKIFIEFHFHLLKKEETIEIFETLRQAGFRIEVAASEAPMAGRYRHKLLAKIMRSIEPRIAGKLGRRLWERELNLSMDDILSNPVILSGQYGSLHIFFARD